jgi:hypothetical protein
MFFFYKKIIRIKAGEQAEQLLNRKPIVKKWHLVPATTSSYPGEKK